MFLRKCSLSNQLFRYLQIYLLDCFVEASSSDGFEMLSHAVSIRIFLRKSGSRIFSYVLFIYGQPVGELSSHEAHSRLVFHLIIT